MNHDANAIRSHAANYPNCLHFTEDIRTIGLQPIIDLVTRLRAEDSSCKIAVWASLECTNFSKAKCGPKDCDSRTLAEHLYRYLDALLPDFLWIENVEEFMLWGPLDASFNPIKSAEGDSFNAWITELVDKYFRGATYGTYISADFGGYTIRKRLFMQFSKESIFAKPRQTHSKCGNTHQKWLPVRDVLDLHLHGASIFTRKRDFVRNTHRRIFKGLKKFNNKKYGIKYYGQDGFQNIAEPSCTLTTKDRVSLVQPVFLTQNYGTGIGRTIEDPSSTLTKVLKQDIVSVKFLHNPQYGGSNRSIEDPAYTLIARQDKAPAGLTTATAHKLQRFITSHDTPKNGRDHITIKNGYILYNIYSDDDEYMVDIKRYMYDKHLKDIMVRPLNIQEMLSIQGFPRNYVLKGTQTEQKKYIGNSVEVNVGIALFQAIDSKIQK